jgi:4-hydroxybenzoate polyprenyltransferase
MRAAVDEEVGVETYSALWGVARASRVWLLAVGIAGYAGILAGWTGGQSARVGIAITLVLVVGGLGAAWVAWRMIKQPTTNHSRWIERFSALWVLSFYLSMGLLPHWG